MTRSAKSSVTIQTSVHSVPATPLWLGEVAVMAHHLSRLGVLAALEEQVRLSVAAAATTT